MDDRSAMPDRAKRMGLFPLNAVLFPGARLPLHIFEERYKKLINECIERGGEFGVALLDNGTISEVGCSAIVAEVVQRFADGTMNVVIEGVRRFHVSEIADGAASYLTVTCDWLDRANDAADGALLETTATLYNELMRKVYGGTIPPLDPAAAPHRASFTMAQKAGMDLRQRQQLLETPAENARLRMLKEYLQELLPKVREAERLHNIIRNDGYL